MKGYSPIHVCTNNGMEKDDAIDIDGRFVVEGYSRIHIIWTNT